MSILGGEAMVPKSVSPWFVQLLASLVVVPVVILGESLLRSAGFHRIQQAYGGFLFGSAYVVAVLLVPKVLNSLGIQVRSRSVERFHAGERDHEDLVTDDLPIRIYRSEWPQRMMAAVLLFGGLFCMGLALCLMLTPFPPPDGRRDTGTAMGALMGIGFVLMGGVLLARRSKPELLCEISEKGIRAPDGFWGRLTLVPWDELTRCEIIHDDERIWYDHFVLWDRSGRRRFRSCKHWLGRMRRSERTRVLRALRSRFPRKEKPDRTAEPALAYQASSAVWDRELDG
jgi:hypothetical protein